MSRIHVATLAAAALMLVPASGAQAKPKPRPSRASATAQLEEGCLGPHSIVEHQTRAAEHRRHERRRRATRKTPGYTASVAYVRERMERRRPQRRRSRSSTCRTGRRTAPPVFEQLTPTAKTYTPGDRRPTTTTRRSTSSRSACSPTAALDGRAGRAGRRHRDPEPGRRTAGERLWSKDDYSAVGGRGGADPARHLPVRHQDNQLAVEAGAVGVIIFNEGNTAARQNPGFRAGPTDLDDPGRVLELRGRRGAL